MNSGHGRGDDDEIENCLTAVRWLPSRDATEPQVTFLSRRHTLIGSISASLLLRHGGEAHGVLAKGRSVLGKSRSVLGWPVGGL